MTDFIQAKNWRWANRDAVRLIVIHTMESREKPGTARAVAQWFGGLLGAAPMASAHACIDDREIVCCVKPEHIAFAAPGANADGYHIEHAGRAAQTPEQWGDEYSTRMLDISAQHAAEIAARFNIPIVRLTVDDILAGKSGFCGHVDITRAYRKSTHTDPGKGFPWDRYIELVKEPSG